MAILEVSHIEKHFGRTNVLKDVSFSMEEGTALAIIGSSGSGKTTLLRCLNFLERPNGGTITVNGETLFDASTAGMEKDADLRRKRLHFGMVFQSFNLFPQYTALQNVTLAEQLLAQERPEFKQNKKKILVIFVSIVGAIILISILYHCFVAWAKAYDARILKQHAEQTQLKPEPQPKAHPMPAENLQNETQQAQPMLAEDKQPEDIQPEDIQPEPQQDQQACRIF